MQGAWCEGFAYHLFFLEHADMHKDSNNNVLFLLFPPTCLGHIGILFPFFLSHSAQNYVNAHGSRRYDVNVKVNAYDMEPTVQ